MAEKKSIAIIGEGETEWFYFDALRITCRHPFKVAPDFPQHSDIPHIAKLAEDYVKRDYDYVVCLIDMDRLNRLSKEMATYRRLRRKSSSRVMWVETNPCTEFWFLLHFLPQMPVRNYSSYEDLLPELQRYMPGYEKTKRYFKRTNLYRFLADNGDIDRAIELGEKLTEKHNLSPEDKIAYSQIHEVLKLLRSINDESQDKIATKQENQKRNGNKRQEICDFIANNPFSDLKSISEAVVLKPSMTRAYLAALINEGLIVAEGGKRSRRYKIR